MHTKTHNIFFVGLMGAGKTTLGRQLAKQLERPFYDSDQIICERTGVSIPTIFEMEGEEGFRLRETAVIDEMTALSGIVLANAGGKPPLPARARHSGLPSCQAGSAAGAHALR